jgi:2-phosphosulfolactate phosphatase
MAPSLASVRIFVVPTPHGQTQYQVRFDWALEGAEAIGEGADVIVWVDQLALSETTLAEAALPDAGVVLGDIQCRRALADWALARQGDLGDRFTVAVVAAGETRSDGSLRFAVEDLLAAGSIIDALADVGIDYCSPEAAAAAAAYTGLRNATGHLISSSASGQALGRPSVDLDPVAEVVVLREFSPAR